MNEPTYSVATERFYANLPEVYRVQDALNSYVLKTWLSGIVDQLGDIELLIARFDYQTPDEKPTGTLVDGVAPYTRGDPTLPAYGATSDLVDPTTADSAWLDWLAQLVGVKLPATDTDAQKRTLIKTASSGWRAGSRQSVTDAVKRVLSGPTYNVQLLDHIATNVIPANDSDFETGTPDWTIGPNWNLPVVDSTDHVTGNNSLKLVRANATPGNGYTALDQRFTPAKPNTRYTLSLWLKGDANFPVVSVRVQPYTNGTGGSDVVHQNLNLQAGVWTQYTYVFVTDSTTDHLQVFVTDDPNNTPVAGATLWMDDVTIDYPDPWRVRIITPYSEQPDGSVVKAAVDVSKPAGVIFDQQFIQSITGDPIHWTESISDTVYACFYPSATLYPSSTLIPC